MTKVNGSTTLNQNRTHNVANEITDITESTGTAWPTPTQDAAGNLTVVPRPLSLGNSFDLKWDAWNRLVEVKNTGGSVIATYRYDGATRHVTKYDGTNTRHYYYSDQWQVLEERLNSSSSADRRFVWGLRSVDDLVLRDDTSQRLYALSDAMGSVTAVVNTSGTVQERYGYDGFGTPRYMTAAFGHRDSSSYSWETLFDGYGYDIIPGLYQVRYRYLHPSLGRWLSRDSLDYHDGLNLYFYAKNSPLNYKDPTGRAIAIGIPAALVALFNALVAALGIAAALLLIWAIIRAIKDCFPRKGPPPRRRPGDCTPAVHDALQAAVDAVCPGGANILTRCEPSDDCTTLKDKGLKFAACATARDTINNQCFRGGDAGHQAAANDARNAVARCAFLITINCSHEGTL